jgi:hypothetical protein
VPSSPHCIRLSAAIVLFGALPILAAIVSPIEAVAAVVVDGKPGVGLTARRVAVREKVPPRWGFCDWVMIVSGGLHARLRRRLFAAAARFNRPYGTRNLAANLQFPAIDCWAIVACPSGTKTSVVEFVRELLRFVGEDKGVSPWYR